MSKKLNIGLLTPIVDGFYFGGLIGSISDFYKNLDTRLFVMQTSKYTATNRFIYNYPVALDYMDGWIILPQAVLPEYLDVLCQTGKPVTMISREINNSACQFILPDNVGGMSSCIEHLIDHGHKRIAFVGWLGDFDVSQRFEGYKNALQNRGIKYSPELVFSIDNCVQSGGYEAANQILESGIKCTAIAAGCDFNALGVIQKLQEAGYRIPSDMAVVGFDNTNVGENSDPALTSVDQNILSIGKTAAKALYRRVKDPESGLETIYVKTNVVARQSCGCKKAEEATYSYLSDDTVTKQKTIEFLSDVIQSSFGIGNSLIKSSSDEIKSLSWIQSAGFHWACLGLFDKQKKLTVERLLGDKGSDTLPLGIHYPMEAFPPLYYLPESTTSDDGDIVWLHPICTESHEWGILALVGPFIKTKLNVNFDTMTHLFDLLSFALELEALSENRYRNLLDNAGQGFLSFGKDLIIDHEYSSECKKIFDCNIEDEIFPELIYPQDKQQQNFLRNILYDLMIESDDDKLKMYMELLPDEIVIRRRNIKMEYKLIEDFSRIGAKKCMLLLTDITDKRKLERTLEHEKNIMKMVIQAVVNYNNFMETSKDYMFFCRNTIPELLDSNLPLIEICSEIFRNIHTFKGNFSQLDMVKVVEKLHEFESDLAEIKKFINCYTPIQFKKIVLEQDMISWFKIDFETLKGILGEQYFNKDNVIVISEKKFKELEKKAVDMLSPAECKNFLHEMRKLRCKCFIEVLDNYPEYTQKLATRLKKNVYFHEIESKNDIPVDMDIYHDFSKSLVNVFRNIVEHGIESPDERISVEKDEFGSIICNIELKDNEIHLIISDDGRGINFEKIRQKILKNGTYTKQNIKKISDQELIKYIFKDEFSTSDTVTDLSGRGMGLSAVANEVHKIGGKIEVTSRINEGTSFHFILPLLGIKDLDDFEIENYTIPIFETAKKVLCDSFGLEHVESDRFKSSNEKRISLNKITSFIKIKGFLHGKFFLSVDMELAHKMVQSFILEDISFEEECLIVEDVLSECTNTILGNSLGLFGRNEEFVAIETPETIFASEGYIKYSESNIFICNFKFKEGNAILGLSYHDNI